MYKVNCPADQPYCRKTEQTINIDGDDQTRIIRECATTGQNVNGECLERLRDNIKKFKSVYCECDTGMCNTAPTVSVSGVVSAGVVMTTYLWKLLL